MINVRREGAVVFKLKLFHPKELLEQGMVAHTYNASTGEDKVGGSDEGHLDYIARPVSNKQTKEL